MTSFIPERQRNVLATLAPVLEEGTYLAGGVAIASALRHRHSRDLDLFVPFEFDAQRLQERLCQLLPHAISTGVARGTLQLEIDTIPVSILSYRYPLLAPLVDDQELHVPRAALDDLLCMKLSAIAGRGAAKDFWDLHQLLERGIAGGSLAEGLALYQKKFPSNDLGHVVRSLAYFADADAAPLPMGLAQSTGQLIKQSMRERVRAL